MSGGVYDLILIDPLVAWAGLPSENDNAAIQKVAAALIHLARTTNGALLVVHHANKAGANELGQAAIRGGSALACAARFIATMRNLTAADCEKFGVDSEHAPNYVELAIAKNSYAPRSGFISILRRAEGGALVDCNLRTERIGRVAEALAAAIDEKKARLTGRELVRGTGQLARTVRTRLSEIIGSAVRGTEIERAIRHGIEFGLLREQQNERTKAGRLRVEIVGNEA